MIDPNKIVDFLKRNNYLITIKPIKKGVQVNFPEIKTRFIKQSEKAIKFLIKRGKKSKVIIDDGTKITIELPEYLIKSYITSQIFTGCHQFGYSYHYICVLDKMDNHVGISIDHLDKLIKSPRGEQKMKEDALITLVSQFSTTNDLLACRALAKERGILEGFNIIVGLLQNKGEEK